MIWITNISEFKVKVALDTIKGERRLRSYRLNLACMPLKINKWKRQALKCMTEMLDWGKCPDKDLEAKKGQSYMRGSAGFRWRQTG